MSPRTACARSRNSLTASASSIGGRSSSVSPAIRSGSRLVARIRSDGAAASSSASGLAASGQQLLEVVEDDVRLLLADARRDRGGVSPDAPRRAAISGTTSAGVAHGASGTKTVPPSASSARNRASSIENRVLPVPPGPTIVSTRGSRSSHRLAASKSSRSRPRKCVAGVGRSTAPGVRSGGNSLYAELEQLRGSVEVLQPVTPEVAQRLVLDERSGRAERITWPPWARAATRAPRWTSIPT